jgi:acyl transferase domain-containing protein
MRQDFAVVGISCRLPKSNSPEEFFQALLEGADCVQENSRWNMKYYNAKERGVFKIPSSRAGLVDNFFTFDNEAFNISKKEAEQMDPQQKILLELALDALEDSNIAYRGTSTGVFVGIGHLGFFKQSSYLTELVNGYTSIGSSFALHANRISNRFDLRGPCFGVDSACNSGGNALFVAMRAMMNKDCDCALVGAVNTLLDVNSTVSFGMMGALSPDGKSKSFDASANGYVRSEGCAFIVVKPLEQAIKDNNHIYCVIKSCTSNMNGQLSPSITRPSGEAQMECLRSALRQANLKPSDIYYVEAHGINFNFHLTL